MLWKTRIFLLTKRVGRGDNPSVASGPKVQLNLGGLTIQTKGGENNNNKHLLFSFFIFLQKQTRRYVKVCPWFCVYLPGGVSYNKKHPPPPPPKKEKKLRNSEIHIAS